jgi:hypothetical protein
MTTTGKSMTSARTITRPTMLLAAFSLLVAGCADDDGTVEATENGAEEVGASDDDPTTDPDADDTDTDADEAEPADDEAEPADDEAATAEGAGTATVVVGDERYDATDMSCDTELGGVDTAGDAEGPRDNARINVRMGTGLPDLVLVSFARGDEGEFTALAENDIMVRGALADYTYDEDTQRASGAAEFVWIDADGLIQEDQITSGTFEMQC